MFIGVCPQYYKCSGLVRVISDSDCSRLWGYNSNDFLQSSLLWIITWNSVFSLLCNNRNI